MIFNAATEGALRLIAGEENRGAGVGNVMLEVVENATAFAHAAAGEDDEDIMAGIQGATFIGGLNIEKVGKIKGVEHGRGFHHP